MDEIKAPQPLVRRFKNVFLAGSIEMGTAEKWQEKVVSALTEYNVAVYNPRRNDWDSSWTQSIDNAQFREQVEWELSAMNESDIIAMHFDPATKSPITLLELGLHARSGKLIVCCPEGYWRKGNVDVVCARYNVEQVPSIDGLIRRIMNKILGVRY